MSDLASTASRFTTESPLPYTRFRKFDLFLFKVLHVYIQHQLNPPSWVVILMWILNTFYLLTLPLKRMYTSGSYFEVLLRYIGDHIDPSFFLSSFPRLVVFFVLEVLLVLLPLFFLVITTMFSGSEKQLHRYFGKATRIIAYVLVSPVSFAIIGILAKPFSCYLKPGYINLAYCTETTQLPLMIIGIIVFVIYIVFIFTYHFFVFESDLTKHSLLRARSGRSLAIIISITSIWFFFSGTVLIYTYKVNSYLQIGISAVIVMIILMFPPFYTPKMNSIILATFLCSIWGGISTFFIDMTMKLTASLGSAIFPNILLYFLIFGVPIAIWICCLVFAPRFFRRNWLVKIDYEKTIVSPTTPQMLTRVLPRTDTIGFSLKVGQDTYVYRKGGYAHPNNTRLLPVASFDSSSSKQTFGPGSMISPNNPNQTSTPTVTINPPQMPSQTASVAILPPINLTSAPEPPTSTGLVQAPTILLQPSHASLPKLVSTPSQMSSRDTVSLLQKMRDDRTKRLQPKQPQTNPLDENNIRDIVPVIAKSIKTPLQFREAIQFLQIPELSTDNFSGRLVDLIFRRLVTKDGFGLQASVRVDYGIFLMQHMGARYQMGVQIQKAVELFPDWTDRWLSFVLTKEMEKRNPQKPQTHHGNSLEMLRIAKSTKKISDQTKLSFTITDEEAVNSFAHSSEGGEDSSTSSRLYNLQAQLSQAQKHFSLALNHLQVMWMYLGRRNVDVAKVQSNALKAMAAEQEATQIYLQLLKENPDNPNVMRQFARLLRDVSCDEEASNMLIQESDRVEDMNDDTVMQESSNPQESQTEEKKLPEKQVQASANTSSAALALFINQLKANKPKMTGLDRWILPLNLFSLIGVLLITIAAYIIAANSFSRFVVQSANLRATLFTAMSAEEIAYLLATLSHLSMEIADPTNLVTDQEKLYFGLIYGLIDEIKPAYQTFNNYVQVFYKACDPTWFTGSDIPYSVPKNLVGGKLGTRFGEDLQLRNMFYRTQERSMELADSSAEFFDDRDGFTLAMLECQMNTHLVITEEVKLLGQRTMEKISSIAATGMMSMMILLGVGTALLLLLATLPLGLKIRSTNKKGRAKMVKVCSISIKTARTMTERLEHSGYKSSSQMTDMDSETSSNSKKETVEENEEMVIKQEEERTEDALDKLKKIGGVVPLSNIVSLVTGTLLIVFVSYTFFILVFVALQSISELSRLIILSGYRRIYLNLLLCFDILSLRPIVFPPMDPSDQSIIFSTDKYSGVILWNTSFVHDSEEQNNIIRRTATFLTYVGSHFINGNSADVYTGDEFYDSLETSGARGRFSKVADLNTRVDDCFLENRVGCDNEKRLGEFTGNFHGLLEVLTTITDRSVELSHDDHHEIRYEDDDMTFLINLTVQDAQSSLKQIGAFLQEELDARIDIFKTALLVVIVVVSILEVFFAAIFLAPISTRLTKIDGNVLQLDRISTSGEDKPLEWSDELRTGLIRIDSPKEMLYGLFDTLREQVEAKEKNEIVQQTLDQIVLVTISIFFDEEELMRQKQYPSAQRSEHARQHALLFKRLVDFATDVDKKRPSLEKTKRFISTWIQGHMASADSDLSLFLRQTLSQSEMNNVPDMNDSALPSSVVRFYKRSNVGMEEKMGVTAVLERVGFDLMECVDGDDDQEMNWS